MDWKGQKLAEKLYHRILILAAFVGFALGYYQQDFALMLKIFGSGTALACMVSPGFERDSNRDQQERISDLVDPCSSMSWA